MSPRFRMGAALEPDDLSARILAAEEYAASDCFVADAVQWVADTNSLPADLVDRICVAYMDSSECATVIDDALDGECSWA